MRIHTHTGELDYTKEGDYILTSPGGIVNISNLLKIIYYHPTNNHIKIKIMNGKKTLFNEDGILYLKVVFDPDITDYFISSEDLTDVLFTHVGDDLEIEIYAEALDYVNNELIELVEGVNKDGTDRCIK
jgi:hypothetical protein